MSDSTPKVELIPKTTAVCHDADVALDLLVRILPPDPEVRVIRPPINLAIVVDRSGSMQGEKIVRAREAATFAVEQLLPTDRLSLTIYDDQIETIVPSTLATDKPAILARLREVQPRGSTNLHGGWKAGADQVAGHLRPEGIHRVLLLSDGLANVGLTDPEAIRAEVAGTLARGVTTTTLGVGKDYNEDLMEAIARAGSGNYYFVESPRQLMDIFQTELNDLMALTGQRVSLGLEPAAGVSIGDVLNDLDRLETGRYKLPDLVVGMPQNIVVRLNVAARERGGEIVGVRLAWDTPKGDGRKSLRLPLTLPAISRVNWEALDRHPEVEEQAVLLMAGRARREAALRHQAGDLAGTEALLMDACAMVSALPGTANTEEDLEALARLMANYKAAPMLFEKQAKAQHYDRTRGKKLS